MSVGPFKPNRRSAWKVQPKQPVTLQQKRKTYWQLFLVCEVYGNDKWRIALERARRRAGVVK